MTHYLLLKILFRLTFPLTSTWLSFVPQKFGLLFNKNLLYFDQFLVFTKEKTSYFLLVAIKDEHYTLKTMQCMYWSNITSKFINCPIIPTPEQCQNLHQRGASTSGLESKLPDAHLPWLASTLQIPIAINLTKSLAVVKFRKRGTI